MTQQDSSRVVFLNGARLYMRPLEVGDAPVAQQYANSPLVRSWIRRQTPISLLGEEEWIKGLGKKSDDVTLGIVLRDGNRLIGSMGLHGINWIDRVATTGALIGPLDCRGKGYGTEAKMILLYHAFRSLGLRKICSLTLTDNVSSLGFNRKCGYTEEGRLKRHIFRNGEYIDAVQTAVFREDWEPLWAVYRVTYLSEYYAD